MRQIAPLRLPDLTPAKITGAAPELRLAAPASLCVDDRYQRGLSERSLKLIRKIVTEWDWSAFKPPVVVALEGERFEVIDGQHTAIAAVSHGSIERIPVLVVSAERQETRAGAFVRHNRDRISVTPTQLHNALVAAGDETALTIEQVCARAGATILRNPPSMGKFKPGETLAITTVRGLVNRRFARGARQVIEICVKAGMAPISAAALKAVECLLFSQEYKDELSADRIVALLAAHGESIQAEADRFAAERKVPLWRALASVVYMNRRKARHVG